MSQVTDANADLDLRTREADGESVFSSAQLTVGFGVSTTQALGKNLTVLRAKHGAIPGEAQNPEGRNEWTFTWESIEFIQTHLADGTRRFELNKVREMDPVKAELLEAVALAEAGERTSEALVTEIRMKLTGVESQLLISDSNLDRTDKALSQASSDLESERTHITQLETDNQELREKNARLEGELGAIKGALDKAESASQASSTELADLRVDHLTATVRGESAERHLGWLGRRRFEREKAMRQEAQSVIQARAAASASCNNN